MSSSFHQAQQHRTCKSAFSGGSLPLQSTGAQSKGAQELDNHIKRGNTRTPTVRNTGTYNEPLRLTRATIVTNGHSTLVFIGDLFLLQRDVLVRHAWANRN